MNFYTLATKLRRDIEKDVNAMCPHGSPFDSIGYRQDVRDAAMARAMNTFQETSRLGIKLMMTFRAIAKEEGLLTDKLKQHYFITIRPNPADVTFHEFYEKVREFTNRKCFRQFELSFEQKGTNTEDLGNGFHCHIIAQLTQRSKGEVLRDTQSTFKQMASANCIQVDVVKTNEDLTRCREYIIDYKADDGHKGVTQEWDAKWRCMMGLDDLYTKALPVIKSMLAVRSSVRIEFLE